jgi:transcriptional regulator with XRE-family HTH domain
MDIKQNKQIALKVISKIPKTQKYSDYLMTKLGLSKETAYRRIRGIIPFSVEEICIIAKDLNFSIDEIIDVKDSYSDHSLNPKNGFLVLMQDYYDYFGLITNIGKPKIGFLMNRINLFFLINTEWLFKFLYYKWLHQESIIFDVSDNPTLSQVIVPEEIEIIRQKLIARIDLLKEVDFIIHKHLFSALTKEIQYFYNRQLITEEEIHFLKEELELMIQNIATRMRQRSDETEQIYNFYLSILDIESNSICCTEHDNNIASLYWLHSSKVLIVKNPETYKRHYNLLESKKRCSMLISRSNEILQDEFIEKQKQYIMSVRKQITI